MAIKGKSVKGKGESLNTLPGGKLNNFLNNYSEKIINFKKSRNFYVFLVVAGLLLLVIYKKSWIVAATVNGSPISNFEVQSKLNQQFKKNVLDQLVTEKIILDEARKNNVIPGETEISAKITEIETQVGGTEALDGLLTQQGQTRASVRNSIKIQLAMTKLYEKEATVSAEEVAQFIEQNGSQLQASDSAGQEKEAYTAIKGQKLNQIFSQKFQELKAKAKVVIF